MTDDIDRLKAFYKTNGFYETKVDATVTPLPPDAVERHVSASTKGPPLRATSFTITGLDSVPDSAAIVRDLPIGKGLRVGLLLVANALDSITARAAQSGLSARGGPAHFHGQPVEARRQAWSFRSRPARGRGSARSTSRRAGPHAENALRRSTARSCCGCSAFDAAIGTATARSATRAQPVQPRRVPSRRHRARLRVAGDGPFVGINVDLREDFLRQLQTRRRVGTARLFPRQRDVHRQELPRPARSGSTSRAVCPSSASASPTHWGCAVRSRPAGARQHRQLEAELLRGRDGSSTGAVRRQLGAGILGLHRAPRPVQGVPPHDVHRHRHASATRNIAVTTPFRLGYTFEYGQTEAEPAFLCALFTLCNSLRASDHSARSCRSRSRARRCSRCGSTTWSSRAPATSRRRAPRLVAIHRHEATRSSSSRARGRVALPARDRANYVRPSPARRCDRRHKPAAAAGAALRRRRVERARLPAERARSSRRIWWIPSAPKRSCQGRSPTGPSRS